MESTCCRPKLDHGIVGGEVPEPKNLRGNSRHYPLESPKGKSTQQRGHPQQLLLLGCIEQSSHQSDGTEEDTAGCAGHGVVAKQLVRYEAGKPDLRVKFKEGMSEKIEHRCELESLLGLTCAKGCFIGRDYLCKSCTNNEYWVENKPLLRASSWGDEQYGNC